VVRKIRNHSKTGKGSVSDDAETRPAFLFYKKGGRFSEFLSEKTCNHDPSAAVHFSFEL